MAPLLQVERSTKRFGGLVANRDVSLAIEPGEIVGLIGPNGAGKTTLFNCISGALHPDEGRITLEEGEEPVDTRGYLMALAEDLVGGLVEDHAPRDTEPSEWNLGGLERAVSDLFGIDSAAIVELHLDQLTPEEMNERIYELALRQYEEKEQQLGIDPAILRRVERVQRRPDAAHVLPSHLML